MADVIFFMACCNGCIRSLTHITIRCFSSVYINYYNKISADIIYCRKGSHGLLLPPIWLLLLAYAIELHCLGSLLLWFLFTPMTFDTLHR